MKYAPLTAAIFAISAATTTFAEEPVDSYDPAKMAEILKVQEDDIVLGSADAPHTMIEYSSLSCSHCAHFQKDVLPAVKEQFIDTGKLRFINRPFPLNAPAFKATILVECAPLEKRAKFEDVLFKLQDRWAYTPRYETALAKIAAVGGISAEDYEACQKDKALEEKVLAERKQADEDLPITGTPSFFLDGKPFTAAMTPEAFTAALATEIDGAAPPAGAAQEPSVDTIEK